MLDAFSRTALLVGEEGMAKLAASSVAVIGVGGVGSYAAEALARCGVGELLLVDDDTVCASNINRQIIALRDTIGRPKVEVMRERILAINPEARVAARAERLDAESAGRIVGPGLSYIVDAIDTVSAKIALILRAKALGIPIVSAMGAGNKLDPARLEVADIYGTSVCPLARVMRRELRKRGVEGLTVIYSREEPIKAGGPEEPGDGGRDGPAGERTEGDGHRAGRRSVPGSIAFVPSAAGLLAASVVVRGILGIPLSKGS